MAAAAAAIISAASTASAAYKYTYTLGRSLYVPLTSRCNSVPLPATRGPGFALPRSVAESLVGVRDAESGAAVPPDWYRDYDESDDASRVYLPPHDLPLVNCLYHRGHDDDIIDGVGDLPGHLRRRRQMIADASAAGGDGVGIADDGLRPSISTLVGEVRSRLDLLQPAIATDGSKGGLVAGEFDQVVIAGEGEATLRMDALLAVARAVRSHLRRGADGDGDDHHRDDGGGGDGASAAPRRSLSSPPRGGGVRRRPPRQVAVRVITNGLCYGVSNLGYSPYNAERDGSVLPVHRHAVLRDMVEAGVSRLSVALNTANRHEYDILMKPCCHTGGGAMMAGGDGGGADSIDDRGGGVGGGEGGSRRSSGPGPRTTSCAS